ncbi:MAG: hypothetical protein IT580_12530 [Verrucomicrobiales bacterium]|nr:hypothetical protein [Verrucomicrobiales bacterium]
MAATLQDLWSAMTNRPVEELENEEKCPDGTPRLSSTIAVWMIGKITEAYGSPLVTLSTVKDADALRSFGGLSRLLVGAIQGKAKSTAA